MCGRGYFADSKSLDDIIDVIADSVEVIEMMKPVYNFKAG